MVEAPLAPEAAFWQVRCAAPESPQTLAENIQFWRDSLNKVQKSASEEIFLRRLTDEVRGN